VGGYPRRRFKRLGARLSGGKERRSRGVQGDAHRCERRWEAAVIRRRRKVAVARLGLPCDGDAQVASRRQGGASTSGGASQASRRLRLAPVGSMAGGLRTAGGGGARLRRTAWLGGGAGHGEIGHAGASTGAAI
jgi:hypothetical protein